MLYLTGIPEGRGGRDTSPEHIVELFNTRRQAESYEERSIVRFKVNGHQTIRRYTVKKCFETHFTQHTKYLIPAGGL